MFRFETTYKIPQGVDLGDPTTCWDPRFQDIDIRLNSCEVQFAQFQQAVVTVTAAGINRVNMAMHPYIDDLTAAVNALAEQVAELSVDTSNAWATTQAQLNQLVAEAQTLVNNLSGLTVIDGGQF